MFGIQAIELYFPKTYVDQSEYQKFKGVDQGKYTKGLGQLGLSFVYPSEDVNSMSLTVVQNLLKNHNIRPEQVGRLEVGTQTFVDKSKSTKTVLMSLFKGNHDIEGATSVNACYGATNALINTLNWISSPFWDGRYGIVVASDIAVYDDGPARCTGGAGAVAMLIGPKPKITFNMQRATFVDNQYDFYKPIPSSEYPVVDGKLSMECYLRAVQQCYLRLKQKTNNTNIIEETDYYCFHAPFYKMVQKAFTKLYETENPVASSNHINSQFMKKVHPTLHISQRIGNIYTGSVFAGLVSLFFTLNDKDLTNKNILLFSYGSGLCSSMLRLKIKQKLLSQEQIQNIKIRLENRIKISPEQFTDIMLKKEQNYGNFRGRLEIYPQLLDGNVFYLTDIDKQYRRKYSLTKSKDVNKESLASSTQRLENLNKNLVIDNQFSKFYKLSIANRIRLVSNRLGKKIDQSLLNSGGLNLELADTMIENVIGTLSLPLSVIPNFVINNKKYMIPMCIEQPSVVAACSSIGKFLAPYSFFTSSTPNVMIGQVHLPCSEINQIHKIISEKSNIINFLNDKCASMVNRGGGVNDLRIRELNGVMSKQFVVDIFVNVCEAMGANVTNMLCQRTKDYLSNLGIKTGIAILSNYCMERKALSYFEIPVQDMGWKSSKGEEVAQKILEAYQFAKSDRYRATTHNKGIMNGIDGVCVATGQDWRAVQSAAHAFASRNGVDYLPLTHYEIVLRDNVRMFRGTLELPISVGSIGGVIQKNPMYETTMAIIGAPSAQELAEILVSVGLAQNFAALRALAVQGINKGHMVLHARTVAQKAGVPRHLVEDACKYMATTSKYTVQAAHTFMQMNGVPKL